MASLISLTKLGKVFSTDEIETHALQDISLQIQKGEYVSISGPSGCGKSTLLSILGLLDSCSSGKYMLAGHDVSQKTAKARAAIRNKEIGFIFQSFNLISDLTVEENVMLPLTYRKEFSHEQCRKMANQVLQKVEMGHRSKHFPSQLSGGQQQRVAVARTIVGSPPLILADEPTGNLDSQNAEQVMAIFDTLHAEGAAICMVTHDPRSAERADRVISILDGKLQSDTKTVAAKDIKSLA